MSMKVKIAIAILVISIILSVIFKRNLIEDAIDIILAIFD